MHETTSVGTEVVIKPEHDPGPEVDLQLLLPTKMITARICKRCGVVYVEQEG